MSGARRGFDEMLQSEKSSEGKMGQSVGPETTPQVGKVIIVDDDRDTREMLTMALELEGFQVEQAANGLRLISCLHVDRPDLILLDVMMSWIDGFELCRSVKKNPDFKDIPIIFLSARKTPDDVKHGLEAGAADYFTKPVDIERLAARIRELIPREATSSTH